MVEFDIPVNPVAITTSPAVIITPKTILHLDKDLRVEWREGSAIHRTTIADDWADDISFAKRTHCRRIGKAKRRQVRREMVFIVIADMFSKSSLKTEVGD